MSLLRRVRANWMPRVGEVLKIYQHDHMLAHGYVVTADRRTISIAGQGIVDLDTDVIRRGIHDGSVRIERNTE